MYTEVIIVLKETQADCDSIILYKANISGVSFYWGVFTENTGFTSKCTVKFILFIFQFCIEIFFSLYSGNRKSTYFFFIFLQLPIKVSFLNFVKGFQKYISKYEVLQCLFL